MSGFQPWLSLARVLQRHGALHTERQECMRSGWDLWKQQMCESQCHKPPTIWDGFYHLFVVTLGMVYYWVWHIAKYKKAKPLPQWLRFSPCKSFLWRKCFTLPCFYLVVPRMGNSSPFLCFSKEHQYLCAARNLKRRGQHKRIAKEPSNSPTVALLTNWGVYRYTPKSRHAHWIPTCWWYIPTP